MWKIGYLANNISPVIHIDSIKRGEFKPSKVIRFDVDSGEFINGVINRRMIGESVKK